VHTFDSKNIYQVLYDGTENVPPEKKMISRPFLNLRIGLRYLINADHSEITSFPVTDQILTLGGLSETEAFQLAEVNTPRLLPPQAKSMYDFLWEHKIRMGECCAVLELYLITNIYESNGAAAVLYPGVLRELADRISPGAEQTDLLLLPSSVHEMMAVPDRGEKDRSRSLSEMVNDINQYGVGPGDVLGREIYRYSRKEDRITDVTEAGIFHNMAAEE